MKIETLKTLIIQTLKRDEILADEIIQEVETLFDLYESDNEGPKVNWFPSPGDRIGYPYTGDDNDKVPYHIICSCNPANGGSGICGCTMANQLVPKDGRSNWTTNIRLDNND